MAESAKKLSEVPDVQSLMAEIRAKVRAELAQAKDLPFVATKGNFDAGNRRRAGELLNSEELRYLNTHYTFGSEVSFDSIKTHRKGFLGKLIVAVKRRFLRMLWDSVLKDYISSEREYQSHLVRFLNDVSKYVDARDASNFWELIRKVDTDVTNALERVERIRQELQSELNSSDRRHNEEVQGTLKEFALLIGELQAKWASQFDRLKVLETVTSGLEAGHIPQQSPATVDASKQPNPEYLFFENRFRGNEAEITKRLSIYPELLKGQSLPILEVGSGRGELLSLLKEANIQAYGVEVDEAMYQKALSMKLNVKLEDALTHLRSLPDHSLGGLVAVQVVEHLNYPQLRELCSLAAQKVAAGGRVILETINPTSLIALSSNYFRDPTHVAPLHPDTLAWCLSSSGLQMEETRFLSPVAKSAQFQEIPTQEYMTPRWIETIESLNSTISSLNKLVFGYQDYCVVAKVS